MVRGVVAAIRHAIELAPLPESGEGGGSVSLFPSTQPDSVSHVWHVWSQDELDRSMIHCPSPSRDARGVPSFDHFIILKDFDQTRLSRKTFFCRSARPQTLSFLPFPLHPTDSRALPGIDGIKARDPIVLL